MTGSQTLIARAALGTVAAVIGLAAASLPQLRQISVRAFDRIAFTALALSRIALYLFTFFVLRLLPRGDIPAYYFHEALYVLGHMLPYRDFLSSYAPLHPYLDAGVLLVWRSPLAIILLAIVVELILLPLWTRLARHFFPEQQVRIATILYVCSPVSLQYVTVDGQDNVIIALLLALGLFALYRGRAAVSGVFVALGIVLVKFLPLLYVPAFFFATRRRLRWLAAFAVTVLLGYGVFAWLKLPLLQPLAYEGMMKSAGNLPYLIEAVFGVALPRQAQDGALLLALLLVVGLIWRAILLTKDDATRLRIVTVAMAALTLTLVLLSKKSWPAYLMFALFPICLMLGTGRFARLRLVAFQLFSVVAVVEHSFWASVFYQSTSEAFHAALVARLPIAVQFLTLQIALLLGYLWLLCEALYQLSDAPGQTRLHRD